MTTRTQQLEIAARKFVNAAEHDMNGTMGKGGNGGLMSDTTLRAAHEVQAILNRAALVHPDDIAVDHFATAMKEKLYKKRNEGRGGWQDKQQCAQQDLSLALVNHMRKGDPVDVANFAMMLHQRGETIALPPMSINIDLADADKARLIDKLQAGTRHFEFLASNPVGVKLVEEDPALSDVSRVIEESGGWWHSCSGCYDTEDGHPTAPYPYSKALRCFVGSGCHECGGLGAVWEYYSAEVLARMQKDAVTPGTEEPDTCPICDEALKSDDICATDFELGICHAECLVNSPVVDLDTGEPVDGPMDTYRYDSLTTTFKTKDAAE